MLEADITEKFSAGLAARYEDYSDFGNTTTGKLSARYAFSDAIALRGTLSTGFRAPSLQQQFFQSTATNFIGGVPFDVRTFAVSDPVAIALGAEPLKAGGVAQAASLGLVLQPVEDLYITIDGYQIDIDDRIVLSENLIGAAVTSFLEAHGIFGVTGGRYFTNAVDTRTPRHRHRRHLSLDPRQQQCRPDGQLQPHQDRDRTDRAQPAAADLRRPQPAIASAASSRAASPSARLATSSRWSALWNVGNWSFNAAATRYGEFTVLFDPASANRDQTFGAEWTLDLAATYNRNGWYFTLGGDNVLDEYPDEVILANSTGGQIPYSAASPFGFNGAFVYGKVGFKW